MTEGREPGSVIDPRPGRFPTGKAGRDEDDHLGAAVHQDGTGEGGLNPSYGKRRDPRTGMNSSPSVHEKNTETEDVESVA